MLHEIGGGAGCQQELELDRYSKMSASRRLGRDTGQYKTIQRLAPDLSRAIEDDLYSISERLLSEDVITAENHRAFTHQHTLPRVRASNLIAAVLNRIESQLYKIY